MSVRTMEISSLQARILPCFTPSLLLGCSATVFTVFLLQPEALPSFLKKPLLLPIKTLAGDPKGKKYIHQHSPAHLAGNGDDNGDKWREQWLLAWTGGLPQARHYSNCLTCINSFNPYDNSMQWVHRAFFVYSTFLPILFCVPCGTSVLCYVGKVSLGDESRNHGVLTQDLLPILWITIFTGIVS